jgi:hypothetical protein
MRRLELIGLRATELSWDRLVGVLPSALEALGLAHDDAATDGQITLRDHGGAGCVLLLDDAALARRTALALATRAAVAVELFEVIATSGGKRFRFRTAAFKATPAGELRAAEGKELDFEDAAQTWGGGELDKQAGRVLEEFALLQGGAERTLRMGYRSRPAGRPSTPRVATLLASLQKAKSHQALPQPGGRFELRIELAAGGKQTSYCSAAEHDELQRLLGGGKA